jgi:hypothetical protein
MGKNEGGCLYFDWCCSEIDFVRVVKQGSSSNCLHRHDKLLSFSDTNQFMLIILCKVVIQACVRKFRLMLMSHFILLWFKDDVVCYFHAWSNLHADRTLTCDAEVR